MAELSHGESEASGRLLKGLAVALALSVFVLALESLGALFSRSLSVLVDAVHNIPDLFAFAISYLSLAATSRGSTEAHTFGSHRLEVFAAILNAFVILTTGVVFAYPALVNLIHGTTLFGGIEPVWILYVAVPTLVLRTASAVYLGKIPRAARDLNVRSVLVHLASDIAITAALLADAVLLLAFPSSVWVDAAVALVVAGILVYESIPIFRGGWDVLSERVPRGVSLRAVGESIRSVPHVKAVHDLHVWSVCPTLVCMTAHVLVDEMTMGESAGISAELRRRVEDEFGIVHAVFELETELTGLSGHPRGHAPDAALTG